MKTATTIALFGGLFYLGYRAKQAAEAVASAAALPPPPPNSGPVVNGIGFYQLEGLHGLSGFGSKLKKTVKKVSGSKAVSVVTKIDPGAAATKKVLSVAQKKSPLIKMASKSPSKTKATAGQPTVYQDANGAVISKAEYDAIVRAMQTGQPVQIGSVWAMPSGVLSSVSPYPPKQSPPFIPPSRNDKLPTYTPSPYEDLNVTSTYSEDYNEGPGTAFTASSQGAPALPEGITTELTTPSAQEAAPEAPAESGTGKWLIGTALAAGAAYLAFS